MTTPQTITANGSMPAVQTIPTNMLVKGVMSTTSSAPECFINQRFSAKLQAFLISYVNGVYSNYPISGA